MMATKEMKAKSSEIKLQGILAEIDSNLVRSLDSLEVASGNEEYKKFGFSCHLYLKVIPEVDFKPEELGGIIEDFGNRYGKRMWALNVYELELNVKFLPGTSLSSTNSISRPVRCIVTNPTGQKFNVQVYLELKNSNGQRVLKQVVGKNGSFSQKLASTPYPIADKMHQKRLICKTLSTTYVYDFLDLFEQSVRQLWQQVIKSFPFNQSKPSTPKVLMKSVELILSKKDPLSSDLLQSLGLSETSRSAGMNSIGMVAWLVTIFAPQDCHSQVEEGGENVGERNGEGERSGEGRELVLIANDITFQGGSFALEEDELFLRASQLARSKKIPRVYISANSGARIGLDKDVRSSFKVNWINEEKPTEGIQFLYLEEKEYLFFKEKSAVNCVPVELNGRTVYKIVDLIGTQDGIGVENLKGSGMIAGETSLAYEQIFTITLVTGRTVGIGSYLTRLGQRTIQNRGPLLLTGADALNKVLGKQVYISNSQLGGPQIMFSNGVSHVDVHTDIAGVFALTRWLTYVPKARDAPLPVNKWNSDPVEREVQFIPPKIGSYDPRLLIQGSSSFQGRERTKGEGWESGEWKSGEWKSGEWKSGEWKSGEWKSGLFDRNSFMETLSGWAKTVCCGRATLGGIPVGVIAVETRTVSCIIPADPACLDSQEQVIQQAGQVWFPDSAFKTAQAIQDFNGEQLPLFILANWRGFSGGMRDMFHEVLKFGALIVDNLRKYTQPVFIYLPPRGELRGGAWAVLDPTINPQFMEMFASPSSRAGILEATGTVEIKFRKPELVSLMERIDSTIISLRKTLSTCSSEEKKGVEEKIKERQQTLLPIYLQIAIKFAELHDTPGRMLAKKCISQVVPWRKSRLFFFFRLKRRLLEQKLTKQLSPHLPQTSFPHSASLSLLHEWFLSQSGGKGIEDVSDKEMIEWLEKESTIKLIQQHISNLKAQKLKRNLEELAQTDPSTLLESLSDFISSLTQDQKRALSSSLEKK